MAGLAKLLLGYVWSSFQSRERLKAEIVVLRHQLNILRRVAPKRPRLSGSDRALFAWVHYLFPSIMGAIAIEGITLTSGHIGAIPEAQLTADVDIFKLLATSGDYPI